jgi:hypothetical protein
VIAQNPIGPTSGWKRRLIFVDQSRERGGVPFCREEGELVREMDAVEIAAVIGNQPLERQINALP